MKITSKTHRKIQTKVQELAVRGDGFGVNVMEYTDTDGSDSWGEKGKASVHVHPAADAAVRVGTITGKVTVHLGGPGVSQVLLYLTPEQATNLERQLESVNVLRELGV